MKILKCPCGGHENGEYFTSLMIKFVNTTHKQAFVYATTAGEQPTWHLLSFLLWVKMECFGGSFDIILGPLDASNIVTSVFLLFQFDGELGPPTWV
jgi:hypothetical protein